MEKECYEEEDQPYRETDYKPIIYIDLGRMLSVYVVSQVKEDQSTHGELGLTHIII